MEVRCVMLYLPESSVYIFVHSKCSFFDIYKNDADRMQNGLNKDTYTNKLCKIEKCYEAV